MKDNSLPISVKSLEICEVCDRSLADPHVESRDGGYSEVIQECSCGALYVTKS